MTYAVLLYHRHPDRIYNAHWIEDCLDSIIHQTFNNFDVLEWDYSGEGSQLYDWSSFYSERVPTFAHAFNLLLDSARDQDYEGAFNVHLDDYYDPFRFESQVMALEEGYDLVSSNFYQVDANNRIEHAFTLDHFDPVEELQNGHNVLCNPVVAFSRRWLEEAHRCDPNLIPREDMACWIRNMEEMKMKVLPEFLCFKRFHGHEASTSSNR